jgi:hypothetical protein
MNYPNNATIDVDALMIALTHQPHALPPDLQQQLSQVGQAMAANQPDAAQALRNLVRSYEPLEAAYFSVLTQWDNEYASQQRAKSLEATFQTTEGFGFIFVHDILPSQDWVKTAKHLADFQMNVSSEVDDQPDFWERGNTIVTMISGGAFLGVLLAQMPGAIIGGVIAGIFGWFSSGSRKHQSIE